MLETGVIVRATDPAEVEALHALAALTFPLACPQSTTEAAKAAFIAEHLSAQRFGEYLADPSRVVLVAVAQGRAESAGRVPVAVPVPVPVAVGASGGLVGYAILAHGEPIDPDVARVVRQRPTAELSKLYVHPAQHGGGVAGALVEALLEGAASRGARSVWLGVNIHNTRANRFYEKSGFVVVGHKGFLVGAVIEDDWVREREL